MKFCSAQPSSKTGQLHFHPKAYEGGGSILLCAILAPRKPFSPRALRVARLRIRIAAPSFINQRACLSKLILAAFAAAAAETSAITFA